MENSKIEQLQADLATVSADRDAFGQNAIDLQKRLSELPSFIAALERFEAEDSTFLRLADVEGAISACVGLRQPHDFNPEHTLFNEIRSSTTVNEDDEPTRYLISAEQLQRIRALEFTNDSHRGPEPVALSVWYDAMPESNGKTNWTAILHRKGESVSKGITIDRSEYPDRVRYEADRMRYLIGEIDKKPWIRDYDVDKHSSYVSPPGEAQRLHAELVQTRAQLEGMHEVLTEAVVDAKAFLASDQGWKWYGNRRDEVEARYNAALSDADSFVKKIT